MIRNIPRLSCSPSKIIAVVVFIIGKTCTCGCREVGIGKNNFIILCANLYCKSQINLPIFIYFSSWLIPICFIDIKHTKVGHLVASESDVFCSLAGIYCTIRRCEFYSPTSLKCNWGYCNIVVIVSLDFSLKCDGIILYFRLGKIECWFSSVIRDCASSCQYRRVVKSL